MRSLCRFDTRLIQFLDVRLLGQETWGDSEFGAYHDRNDAEKDGVIHGVSRIKF
jgi:hypothetical protein